MSHNPNYNWVIKNPYKYTDDEQKILDDNPPKQGDDWGNSRFDSIKTNIREHLTLEQFDRCPYCRTLLNEAGYYSPREHIVHKDQYFQFMFLSKNLAISCTVCNTHKGTKQTLKNPSRKTYPNDGDDFIIIHPHFDNYLDHIEIVNELFIRPKNGSIKGRNTIDKCNLLRFHVAIQKARELNYKDEKKIYKKVLLWSREQKDLSNKEKEEIEKMLAWLFARVKKNKQAQLQSQN